MERVVLRKSHNLLPSGNNAKAFDINPAKPTIANGCSGNTDDDNVDDAKFVFNIPDPKNHSMIVPPNILDCKMYVGNTGNMDRSSYIVDLVIVKP